MLTLKAYTEKTEENHQKKLPPEEIELMTPAILIACKTDTFKILIHSCSIDYS